MRMKNCLGLMPALFIMTSCASAGDFVWPGWLGPQRNGWVPDFDVPAEWPSALQRVWQKDVGTGYGTPIVVGDRVYQHARQGEDEVLWCFRLSDGAVVWRKAWPVPFQIAGGGERHGKGPKSCPVYADGRVFTMSISGQLRAWDAETGEFLWHSDLEKKFPKPHPNWGAATSPIVDEDRVITHFGTDEAGALAALDVGTGKVVWSVEGDGASYSSPLIVTLGGVRQVVEWNHEALVGVSSQTGEKLWSFPFPHEHHNQNMPTPIHYQGHIILGAENRGIRSLKPYLRDDGTWSVEKNWETNEVALDMSTAVINGDLLFGMSHYRKGCLFCLDAATGKVLWQGPGRTGENVTFLSVPGAVVALASHGELRRIEATGEEFRQTHRWQVGDDWTWSPPVLFNGGLLVKDRSTLTLWKF